MATDRYNAIDTTQIKKHTLQQDDLSPDALVWQEPIEDKDLTVPPSSGNAEGDRYLVASGATGFGVLAGAGRGVADVGAGLLPAITLVTTGAFAGAGAFGAAPFLNVFSTSASASPVSWDI